MPIARIPSARGLTLVFLLACALAAGCRRSDASAVPALAADSARDAALAPVAPTLSQFAVPLEYDFTPLLRSLERAVPMTMGSLDSVRQVGDDEKRHYSFVATRGPFTAFAKGSQVHLRTTIDYSARGFYKPPVGPTVRVTCGKGADRPQIVVELVAPLTISRTWHLRSAARLERIVPSSDSAGDHCQMGFLKMDVTNRVVDAAEQAIIAHLPDIDRKVATVDLTDKATGWWKTLNQPIRLADGVWLLLQPQQLRVGRVTGERHTITVLAGLDAYPVIVMGPEEPRPVVPPLPPLGKDTSASGFRVMLEGFVDYAGASKALTDELSGKTVTKSGRTITVMTVSASPEAAGHMALSVAFTGDATGTLRLAGTPKYDATSGQITVPDLDYDLKTDNSLINAYAWLRSDTLLAMLREKAQVPVAPVLVRGKALLTDGLNRTIGEISLSATVDSVAVVGLYVTAQGLMVRASASGTAKVRVRQRK